MINPAGFAKINRTIEGVPYETQEYLARPSRHPSFHLNSRQRRLQGGDRLGRAVRPQGLLLPERGQQGAR